MDRQYGEVCAYAKLVGQPVHPPSGGFIFLTKLAGAAVGSYLWIRSTKAAYENACWSPEREGGNLGAPRVTCEGSEPTGFKGPTPSAPVAIWQKRKVVGRLCASDLDEIFTQISGG
jgi:hypothetical protein